jgi:hypothetical protein
MRKPDSPAVKARVPKRTKPFAPELNERSKPISPPRSRSAASTSLKPECQALHDPDRTPGLQRIIRSCN